MGKVVHIKKQVIENDILDRCRLIDEHINILRALNPPIICGKGKGKYTDEMNEILIDLLDLRKKMKPQLEKISELK